MGKAKKIISVRFFTIAIVATLGITGCPSNTSKPYIVETIKEDGQQAPAHISFSYPQIFTRESLINDRINETQYLNNLLSDSVNLKFESQLRRNLATITALTGSLGIAFDASAKLNYSQSNDLDKVKREIELTKLRMELDQVKEKYSQLQNSYI